MGDFPQNQTVHIFIFAHRSIPTGHQYAKPRPAASVYSRLQERSLNQTNFGKREIISALIPLCVRAKLSALHHRADKSCSDTLQKFSTDSTHVDIETVQVKHKKNKIIMKPLRKKKIIQTNKWHSRCEWPWKNSPLWYLLIASPASHTLEPGRQTLALNIVYLAAHLPNYNAKSVASVNPQAIFLTTARQDRFRRHKCINI